MRSHRAPRRRVRLIGVSAILAAGVVLLQSFVLNADAAASTDRLNPGERLTAGGRLVSANGQYVLIMQQDGNLVEYAPGNRPVWATGTARTKSEVRLQSDGNLVVVAPGNVPVWSTRTDGNPNATLELQNDGNVVLYAQGHQARWSSGRVGGNAPKLGSREKELLSLRGTIVEAAQQFDLDPVLLAAVLHHEGGNYLDPVRRNITAPAEEALAKTRGASVGIGQVQTGTARLVLREKFGITDLSDDQIIEHLIYDTTFSIDVVAGYLDWMKTRTVDGRDCGALDRRELFLQYAVDNTLACTLRDYDYDVARLSTDAAVAVYMGVKPPASTGECSKLKAREGYFTSSQHQAELVMAA